MKKIFLMLSLMFCIGWATTFAKDNPNLDPRVEESFKKEFPTAQHVKWTEEKEFAKAVFVLADYRVEAWFSAEGELLATSRDLLYDQLPLAVMKELDKRFPASRSTEVREISNSKGTSYQLILETVKRKYKVSITPNGEVLEMKKIK